MRSSALLFTSFLAFAYHCWAEIYTHPDQLSADAYDFVIVGGGTAGLVVANRLSETNYTVLVIEAGGSHSEDVNITVPFFQPRTAPQTQYDWNYTTVPQANLNDRALLIFRGHLLGGSSSINSMTITRGSRDDYDRIAEITGDSGWSWDALFPYILKSEKVTPPADGHNTTGQYDPAVHGESGLHPVTLPGFHTSLNDVVLQASQELSDEFPYNVDFNGGTALGIGWQMQTIHSGERSSTATSFLLPFTSRTNLDVLVNAFTLRVHADQNSTDGGTPLFSTVEYSIDGNTYNVTAKKEIIVSAGAINTPALLLHSGIGNETELTALGINPIVNLPSVGKNLTDHPEASFFWTVNSTDTMDPYYLNATRLAEAQERWEQNRTGPLVCAGTNQLGFFRLEEFEGEDDPTAGPNSPHYEMIFFPSLFGTADGFSMGIGAVVMNPTSRGAVKLKSSDPTAPPLIYPSIMETDLDRRILRGGLKKILQFVEAPVFQDYIIAPKSPLPTSDDELDAFITDNAVAVQHFVSTASMSPSGADWGVVDPDLRVKGVRGLRVVDASVFPKIPSAHTQMPVIIIAERASDIIKEAWV